MARIVRLKKRLVREAIEENLDTIRAVEERKRRYRRQRARLLAGRIALLSGIPILFAATIQFVNARAQVSRYPDATSESNGTASRASGLLSIGTLAWAGASRQSPLGIASAPPPLAALDGAPSGDPAGTAPFGHPSRIDPAVLPLGIRRVVIDPGHGGTSPGASAGPDVVEKEISLDIGLRVRALLESAGFRVTMSRDDDRSVSLEERAAIANLSGGDIFVSIHVNSFPAPEARGVETYFLGPTDDPALKHLAAIENKDSGYSLGDYKTILERIYLGVRQDESRLLAQSVQASIFSELHRGNPAVENRGVKTAPFIVLVGTEMPAILAEVSSLSNDQDARLLKDEGYRQRIATALFRGIHAFADSHMLEERKGG